MRILFVDDHPEFTATVIAVFLAADDVTVVATVSEAIDRLTAGRFDVVLVDYDLDDGKGDELVHWVRTSQPHQKLVGVSARDAGNERLSAAGVDAVCAKVAFSRIQAVLRDLVG
jgi:CheY-like chemotaxis protein